MLTMRFGSTDILGVRLTDKDGVPLEGATVEYEILDRAGNVVLTGSMTEVSDPVGSYEDEISTDEFVDLAAISYVTALGQKFKAKINAAGPAGETGQALIPLYVQHDTD